MRDGLHPSLVYASLSGLFRIALKGRNMNSPAMRGRVCLINCVKS